MRFHRSLCFSPDEQSIVMGEANPSVCILVSSHPCSQPSSHFTCQCLSYLPMMGISLRYSDEFCVFFIVIILWTLLSNLFPALVLGAG